MEKDFCGVHSCIAAEQFILSAKEAMYATKYQKISKFSTTTATNIDYL